jgi:hypothetical protein
MQLVLLISTIGFLPVHIPFPDMAVPNSRHATQECLICKRRANVSRLAHAGYLVGVLTVGRTAKEFKVPDHNVVRPFRNRMAFSAMTPMGTRAVQDIVRKLGRASKFSNRFLTRIVSSGRVISKIGEVHSPNDWPRACIPFAR